MRNWDALTLAEQTLLRGGAHNGAAAWVPENYSMARRWAGHADASLRSLTADEAQHLAAELRPVALDLQDRELFVAEATGKPPFYTHHRLPPAEQRAFLADPDNWRVEPAQERRIVLDVECATREHLTSFVDRLDAKDHPFLSPAERELIVCAYESSGWLTGLWGIWEELPPGLDHAARLALVDEQVATLLPMVRKGGIEVHHVAAAGSREYTVLPLEHLREALADPAIRYEGDEFEIGVTCILTYAGVAISCRPRGT